MNHHLINNFMRVKISNLQEYLDLGKIPNELSQTVSSLTRNIASSASVQETQGSIVLGSFASGYVEATRSALDLLSTDSQIIRLVGTEYGHSIPFGALLGLLGPELPASDIEIGPVSRLLSMQFAQQPTVIAVEHADLLDDETIAIITHLVTGKFVSVIIAAEALFKVPAALRALARSGLLRALEPVPLTRNRIAQAVMDYLQVSPSPLAIDYLWRLSGGQLWWFVAVMHSALSCGSLTICKDSLVLTEQPMKPASPLRSLALIVAKKLSDSDRESLWKLVLNGAIEVPLQIPDSVEYSLVMCGFVENGDAVRKSRQARMALLLVCLVPDGSFLNQWVIELRPTHGRKGTLPVEHPMFTVLNELVQETTGLVSAPSRPDSESVYMTRNLEKAKFWLANKTHECTDSLVVLQAMTDYLLVRGSLTKLRTVLEGLTEEIAQCPHVATHIALSLSMLDVLGGHVGRAELEIGVLARQAEALSGLLYSSAILSLNSSLAGDILPGNGSISLSRPGILENAVELLAVSMQPERASTNRLIAYARVGLMNRHLGLTVMAHLLLMSKGQDRGVLDHMVGGKGFLAVLWPAVSTISVGTRARDGLKILEGLKLLGAHQIVLSTEGFGGGLLELTWLHTNPDQMRSGLASPSESSVQLYFPGIENLTKRERQMAREVGRGRSTTDIAERFGISMRTVEGHLYQIYAKVSVTHRRALQNLINGEETGVLGDEK